MATAAMAAPELVSAAASAPADRRPLGRVRAAVAAAGAAVLGAAPHVFHHAGPLAGAAVLAGATGKLLFGVVGFVLAVPMLRRVRRRTGSWRIPGALLASMGVIFTVSSFVIGPALTGAEDEAARPAQSGERPPGVSPSEHEAHHP
jgi:hypothetical protein